MSEFNKNDHLDCVLKSHSIKLDSGSLLDNYRAKRNKVKEALDKEFSDKIIKTINSGSYAKHTAINTKFDMDLCNHFKKGSFDKLQDMYDAVYKFLNEDFDDDDIIYVREQKVSIGLKFNVDGEDILFDVTPGRQLNDAKEDNDIYLYINDETDANRTKTNIHKQIEKIQGRHKERENIKLLKVWKSHHFKVKSFLVELLVMKAYDKEKIEDVKDLWERLKKVIEFIRDNIETVTLIDPGNSGNNVAKSLTDDEKKDFKKEMANILDEVEKDSTQLKHFFPINSKYADCDNTQSNSQSQSSKLLGLLTSAVAIADKSAFTDNQGRVTTDSRFVKNQPHKFHGE